MMGYYINPADGRTKERWLEEEATQIPASHALELLDGGGDEWPVCLVNNGLFTAAGIAYDQREAEAFLHPDDRPKQWYKVKHSKLNQFLPDAMKVD